MAGPFALPHLLLFAGAGVISGLSLFVRGLLAYRRSTRVSTIAGSQVASLAAGEVRLTGTVVPLAVTLVSPLQSVPCVWYRSAVMERDGGDGRLAMDSEQAVEFALRDETGEVRIVPRGATWDFPARYRERSGAFGDEPPGLMLNRGASTASTELDHEAAVRALLTVRPPAPEESDGLPGLAGRMSGSREYIEARLEPGETVTVVGFAVPYGELPALEERLAADAHDAEMALDLAAAREAGILAPDAASAWGNAAIPGFGIGQPTRAPVLHQEADTLPLASPERAARAERLFDVPAETLVVAEGPNVPLVVYPGTPADAASGDDLRFFMGLLGAVLAIASAVALALMLNGGI